MSLDDFEYRLCEFEKNNIVETKDWAEDSMGFKETFTRLYEESKLFDLFWRFCPFDVYKITFEEREKGFLNTYSAKKTEFIHEELEEINECYDHIDDIETLFYPNVTRGHFMTDDYPQEHTVYLYELLPKEDLKKLKFDNKRKIEFLNEKLNPIDSQKNKINNPVSSDIDPDENNEYKVSKTISVPIKERYEILKKVIDLQKLVESKDGYYKANTLLAFILQCDEHNARKLLTNKYNPNSVPDKEKINKAISHLKR